MNIENQLLAEIEFWQNLIEGQDTVSSEDSLERMRLAKELAEHKLALFRRKSEQILN